MNHQPRQWYGNLRQTSKPPGEVQEHNMVRNPELVPGDAVFTLKFGIWGSKWLPGTIVTAISPMNYDVPIRDSTCKGHQNQLSARHVRLSLSVWEDDTTDMPYIHNPTNIQLQITDVQASSSQSLTSGSLPISPYSTKSVIILLDSTDSSTTSSAPLSESTTELSVTPPQEELVAKWINLNDIWPDVI